MITHIKDSVVKIGQPEFLFIICSRAIMSTSAIIPLTLAESGVGEDTAAASRSCQAVPFLYSIGWVLMHSLLTAKSYQLTTVAAAATRMRRKKVTAKEMYRIIIAFLVLDAVIMIAWQVVDPLLYIRSEMSKSVDDDTCVVTIKTVGQCSSNSMWIFLARILVYMLVSWLLPTCFSSVFETCRTDTRNKNMWPLHRFISASCYFLVCRF